MSVTTKSKRPLARRMQVRPGGGNWKLNLAAGRPERIRLRGQS